MGTVPRVVTRPGCAAARDVDAAMPSEKQMIGCDACGADRERDSDTTNWLCVRALVWVLDDARQGRPASVA